MTALLRSAEVDGHTNWASLIDEALLLAEHEPVLSAYACRIVIDSESLEVALSKLLSERLSTLDVCRQELFGSFRTTYFDDPSLGIAAWNDLKATKSRDPACFSTLCALLNLKGFQGLQSYRVAHALWLADRKPLATWISNRVSQEFGIDIHPAARIGQGVMLDHGSGIVIGETAVIERNVSILQNVTLGGTGKITGDRHPKVKEGVMIGAGAKVIGNIQIGAHSKIAAGSVVLKPVPANSTVAGVPAQIVRTRDVGAAPAETMDQEL